MNKKYIVYTGLFLILSALVLLGRGGYVLHGTRVSNPQGMVYLLKPGTSKKTFLNQLQQAHIITPSWFITLYTYTKKDAQLKAGEYFFKPGSSFVSIWHQVTRGKGVIYHTFSIIPGWSFQQVRQHLALSQLRHDTASLTDQQVMAKLGYSQVYPEGEFFPDTYYYTRGLSDLTILKHAFDRMQNKLQSLWQTRAPQLPYKNAYEVLIAASLIEKEAYLNSERPIISGVLINRLNHDMLLQFDPTVIYGLGNQYDGKLHKNDLLNDTAYNTYLHKGLPPTPIAMPGIVSLNAAFHPQINDYYYFVARGDGSHQFSKTLVEHNQAVLSIKQQVSYFNDSQIILYLQRTIKVNL